MLRFFEHRIFRVLGYSTFFSVLFGVFLVIGFPAERFKSVAERQLNEFLDRDVKIAEMGISLFGNLVLSNLEIAQSADEDSGGPLGNDAKSGKPKRPLPYLVEEAVLDLGLFGLLFDDLDVAVDLEAFGGDVHLSYDGPFPKKETKPKKRKRGRKSGVDAEEEEKEDEDEDLSPIDIHGDAEGIELRRLPDLSRAISMPVSGEMSFDVSLESDSGMFKDASGEFELLIESIGLSKPGYEADIDGLTIKVPPIKIASIDVKMKVEDGVGTIEKFDVKSKHLDVTAEGTIAFSDPISKSQMDLYITFKLADAYVNQSDAFKLIYGQLETFKPDLKRAKRDDGYYGFRYKGPLGKGRFTPQKKPTAAKKERPKKKRRPKKPRRGAAKDRKRKGAADKRPSPKALSKPGNDLPLRPERDDRPAAMSPRGQTPEASIGKPKGSGFSPRIDRPAAPVEEEEPADEEVEEEESPDEMEDVEQTTEGEGQEEQAGEEGEAVKEKPGEDEDE